MNLRDKETCNKEEFSMSLNTECTYEQLYFNFCHGTQPIVNSGIPALICPNCREESLIIDVDISCESCGYADKPEKVARKYSDSVNRRIYFCPVCDNCTLVPTDGNRLICFECHTVYDDSDFEWCLYCGEPYVDISQLLGACQECAIGLIKD